MPVLILMSDPCHNKFSYMPVLILMSDPCHYKLQLGSIPSIPTNNQNLQQKLSNLFFWFSIIQIVLDCFTHLPQTGRIHLPQPPLSPQGHLWFLRDLVQASWHPLRRQVRFGPRRRLRHCKEAWGTNAGNDGVFSLLGEYQKVKVNLKGLLIQYNSSK